MKKVKLFYLVAVLALLAISVIMFSCKQRASVVPDGFAGVPWGATKDQIIHIMGKRPYGQIAIGSGVLLLQFKGEFAEVPSELEFRLIADSFYEGYARIRHTETPQVTFKRIVDMLSEKYGPTKDRESGLDKDDKGIDHPYESAFWRLADKKSSDTYTIQTRLMSFNVTNKIQYEVDVNYRAYSLEERLKMSRIGAHSAPTNVNAQAGKRQYTATSPSSPQAAAADWKQYEQNEVRISYYDANSIRRSGDVVQVATLTKFDWSAFSGGTSLTQIDHMIELLEINCRSKSVTRKRIIDYKADGSVIYDSLLNETIYSEDLLYHIVCKDR